MIDENKNPWQILSNAKKYESPWIKINEYDVIHPSGKNGIYGVVDFKNYAIGILPLDKDLNTWIVGQYRFPLNKYSWEIPEGGGPKNIDILDSAKRELVEECGIIAKDWRKIYHFNTSNSCTNEHAYIFLATDLTFTQSSPEDSEQLQVKKIPFSVLYEMVLANEITDSLTIIAVFKVHDIISNGLL